MHDKLIVLKAAFQGFSRLRLAGNKLSSDKDCIFKRLVSAHPNAISDDRARKVGTIFDYHVIPEDGIPDSRVRGHRGVGPRENISILGSE